MSDDKTTRDKIMDILSGKPFPELHDPADTVGETVGSFKPVQSVYLTEETLTWLHNTLVGDGDVYTEKVELETTEGTFVITAENDTVHMEYKGDDE